MIISVRNTFTDLMDYLGVKPKEFMEFWNSLSLEDLQYYRTVDLDSD